MKARLIYVGKTSKSFLVKGEGEYLKRLKRYISFEIVEIPDIKNAKMRSFNEIKSLEGKQIIQQLKTNEYVVLLDEKGKEMTSLQFSNYLQKHFNSETRRLTFIIGGPYGFSKEVYDRANEKMALSKLTFSHQMIRMFFLEQVYRAMTILKGEPYHHE